MKNLNINIVLIVSAFVMSCGNDHSNIMTVSKSTLVNKWEGQCEQVVNVDENGFVSPTKTSTKSNIEFTDTNLILITQQYSNPSCEDEALSQWSFTVSYISSPSDSKIEVETGELVSISAKISDAETVATYNTVKLCDQVWAVGSEINLSKCAMMIESAELTNMKVLADINSDTLTYAENKYSLIK